MLILAGVSMSMVTGEGSVLDRAIEASEKQEIAAFTEELNLLLNDYNMASVLDSAKTNREDKFFSVNKQGKSYTVSDNYSVVGEEAGNTMVIAPSKVGENFTLEMEDGKTYSILDDVNVENFNFDIKKGQNVSIKLVGQNMKIDNKNYKRSAINLEEGATLNLYVYGNVEVNSGYGENATGNTPGKGAYAGIHVPFGATLNLYGTGTITAIGGDAGDGEISKSNSLHAGGGGAGAGIGGAGGPGGAGETGTSNATSEKCSPGGKGGDCGTINIHDSITVIAYGGGGGAGGTNNAGIGAGGGG